MTAEKSRNKIVVFILFACVCLAAFEVWSAITPGVNIAQPTETRNHLAEILSDERYSQRLRDAAEKNSDLIDFIYYYPDRLGTYDDFDLTRLAQSEEVPLLFQWDSRWGYAMYGDDALGFTGCGPVCLSMAALYFRDDALWDPIRVSRYAEDNGYYFSGSGSQWSLISQGSQALGLDAREISLSFEAMTQALNDGEIIIAVLGPGDFTDSGHFIVIKGYNKSSFAINDPNSRTRSEKLWDYEVLESQIMDMWAISRS